MLIRRSLAVVLVAALAFSACDGDGSSDTNSSADETTATTSEEAAPAQLPDRGCDLVTADDAEAVLGGPVLTDEDIGEGVSPAAVSCAWERDLGGVDFSLLLFEIYEGEEFYGEAVFAEDAESLEQLDLGDRSFVALSVTGLTIQFLLDGNTVVLNVNGNGIDPADFREELLDLARHVEAELS